MDGKTKTPISFLIFFVAVLAAITAVFVFSGPDALGQSAATVIAIAKMEVGAAPADFDFARTGQGGPGQWTVVADTTAFGDRAIQQSSTDATDYRFPLAILKSVVANNVDISLRFKPVAGRVDQAGGLAVRLLDPDNYYVVRANALEDNVRFYRVVKGRREQLGGTNIKVSGNTWHSLGLKAQGDQFIVEFDGKTLFKVSDPTFVNPGKIALWTKSDSVTRFDQIAIDVLSEQ